MTDKDVSVTVQDRLLTIDLPKTKEAQDSVKKISVKAA